MLSRRYGYYLVYTECTSICLTTFVCALNASNLHCLSWKAICETTQQRIAIDQKRIINVLPILKPTDAKQE